MTVLGLGHDVVDVAAFAAQLAEPGTRMRALFSARELRQAALRAQAKGDGEAVHLAARWAGKEAVLKAWCEALSAGGAADPPYTLDDFPWARVEILDDSRGVPHVALGADVEERLVASLISAGEGLTSVGTGGAPTGVTAGDGTTADRRGDGPASCFTWHISLSHDGPVASAVALLERAPGRGARGPRVQ